MAILTSVEIDGRAAGRVGRVRALVLCVQWGGADGDDAAPDYAATGARVDRASECA